MPEDNNKTARKVLCIEDEYFIGELYERALKKAGYDTVVVLNGSDGLQLAQTNKYDIILLDLMVPGMTGIEVLRVLRDNEKSPGFKSKVIITTNLDQDEQTRAEVESRADGYLIKAAITPKELVAYLDKLVLDH
jgi:DNA-binding response OmpR family regulator